MKRQRFRNINKLLKAFKYRYTFLMSVSAVTAFFTALSWELHHSPALMALFGAISAFTAGASLVYIKVSGELERM